MGGQWRKCDPDWSVWGRKYTPEHSVEATGDAESILVRLYSVTRLVEQMEKAYNAGVFDEKIRDVNKPKLLILDELRHIPFTPQQGQLLFELISARYEKKSIIVNSNKMPGEWGTAFGDAASATASLDRLLPHLYTHVHPGGKLQDT